MIKNIIFDLGGVILTLTPQKAAQRFEEIGLKNAAKHLDSYTQSGIFGALEGGDIDAETFRRDFSMLTGREATYQECCYAWQGYVEGIPPRRNIEVLKKLKSEGYRLVLLSNTNPYMMEFVDSPRFDGEGHSVTHYFDAIYLSYKMKVMKPDESFFRRVLMAEQILPSETLFVDDGPRNVAAASQIGIHTFCPANGEDWTKEIYDYLG